MTHGLRIVRIAAREQLLQPWRNGLGMTREIARFPLTGDWDWRMSIARIDADSAFSSFPGVDRWLLLLRGNGLRLRFADGETLELAPPHGDAAFAGERGVAGELIDGPTDDFNLMWRRDRIAADCWLRPLVGNGVLAVAPQDIWAVHLIAGRLQLADGIGTQLAAGDAAVIESTIDAPRLLRYEGSGTAIVMRMRPLIQSG